MEAFIWFMLWTTKPPQNSAYVALFPLTWLAAWLKMTQEWPLVYRHEQEHEEVVLIVSTDLTLTPEGLNGWEGEGVLFLFADSYEQNVNLQVTPEPKWHLINTSATNRKLYSLM